MKRLLVLGAGPAQLGLLAAARERELFVIAADRNPAAPGFRYADRRAIVSAEDEEAIERLASAEAVDGIIAPGIDWPVGIAARVAPRLGVPHPISPEAAVLATSKRRQRERFADAGVPQPAFAVCRSVEETAEAVATIGLPCVVKAPDRQGQRGLALVRSADGLPEAAAAAIEASRSGSCIVEQYAAGGEVTVNGFSLGGRFHPLTVTDRLVAEPPAFGVALAHVWPSEHAPERIGEAVEAAAAAAAAVGIGEGPSYTQVLVAEDGVRVVELAARLGGGHDAELCRAALGVDLNGLALSAALGDEIDETGLVAGERAGGACVRFLVARPGLLEAVSGVDDAQAVEGIRLVLVYRRPGFVFGPLRRGTDRAGAVLAVGESRGEALDRAARAADVVRFEVAAATALA